MYYTVLVVFVCTVHLQCKIASSCLCWTMMKRAADNSRRGSPNYWLACNMGEMERIRGIVTERRNTPHNQSHRRHVARTGNDQTVAAASEHMPRMSPNIRLSRQTAPAAVCRRRNRWYVYTYLELRSEEQIADHVLQKPSNRPAPRIPPSSPNTRLPQPLQPSPQCPLGMPLDSPTKP